MYSVINRSFVLSPGLQDESFLIDCQSAILHCLSLPSPAVRVQASWALANFTDPLSFTPHPALKQALYTGVVSAVRDGDKVRCNGVRAAGNLLKELTEEGTVVCAWIVCVHRVECMICGLLPIGLEAYS